MFFFFWVKAEKTNNLITLLNVLQQGGHRVGQGYADVLVPPGGGAGGWLWGGEQANAAAAPEGHNVQNNANIPQQPTSEVSEDQVSVL